LSIGKGKNYNRQSGRWETRCRAWLPMKIFLLISWTLLLALNIFDACTTFILLEHDGKELNFAMNWFIKAYGPEGLFYAKSFALLFLTFVTVWISDVNKTLNLRQHIVVIGSYLIAICYYSYIMYNYNYIYMKSFGV
jgi:hypothetical protein